MARLIQRLFLIPKAIFRSIYFLLVIALIAFIVLLFGHPILGPGLPGSDNANFITLANWLSEWFPKIPFWFPQEGAGMSFVVSYPILNHLIVVLIEKIFTIPIAIAFRIYSLFSIVLTAIGLYLLSFRLTKNHAISSLAAIFYPLCPITWTFLLNWGFSAEQFSFVFIPPVLIFLSLFLDEFYSNGLAWKTKIYFLLFVILFAVLPIAHPLTFIGMTTLVSILLIIYPLLNYKSAKVNFGKTIVVGLVSIAFIFLLSSYWLVPFFRYQSIVAKGAPVEKGKPHRNAFLQNGIYPLSVFNISDKSAVYKSYDDLPQNISSSAWRNVSFPFIISVLALIGLVGSFFINRKVFALSLANMFPLGIAIFPQFTFYLLKLPLADYFLSWRAAITPSRIIIPLLAGFGCYALAYLATFPLDLLSKKIKSIFIKYPLRAIFIIFSTSLTLAVAGLILWYFKSWPVNNPRFLISYGTDVSVPSSKIDLRNVWRTRKDNCFGGSSLSDVGDQHKVICSNYTFQEYFWASELSGICNNLEVEEVYLPSDVIAICGENPDQKTVLSMVDKCKRGVKEEIYADICRTRTESFIDQVKPIHWTEMFKKRDLFGMGRELFGSETSLIKHLPDNPNTRIDVGTSMGAFMMFVPFYSNVPELPVYYNQATLIKNFWNYQIGVFNQKETVWPQDKIISELSKYFGLEYMILSENLVPLDKYERTGWERISKWDEIFYEGLALWKFKYPAGLLRATTKPVVLVIGQDKVDGYFRIFHLANLGVLPYEEALLVKGEAYPDAYSVKELKNFDAVVLEGYSYKNQSKGWKVLDDYVKSGGSLLINTGWQYSSADWQLPKTPNFFPLKTLKWINAEAGSKYKMENSKIAGEVDVEKFDPLIYDNKPWSISSSERSDLRDWAKVVISANEKPLVAGGSYGSGKVVWMGLDLPGHIGAYGDNEEEVKLYKNLLSYLLKTKEGNVLNASFVRNYPDKLEITINESSSQKVAVYWSEAYYPDFKAKLVTGNKSEKLKVYKAGPGMTLLILPSVNAGSKIVYEYKTPFVITASRVISLLLFLTIIAIIIRPQFLEQIKKILFDTIEKLEVKKKIKKSYGDEDLNY